MCDVTVEVYCCSVLECQQRFLNDCTGSTYQGNQSCIKDDEEVRSVIEECDDHESVGCCYFACC